MSSGSALAAGATYELAYTRRSGGEHDRVMNGNINIDEFVKTDILKDPKLEKEELAKMVVEYNNLTQAFWEMRARQGINTSLHKFVEDFDRFLILWFSRNISEIIIWILLLIVQYMPRSCVGGYALNYSNISPT